MNQFAFVLCGSLVPQVWNECGRSAYPLLSRAHSSLVFISLQEFKKAKQATELFAMECVDLKPFFAVAAKGATTLAEANIMSCLMDSDMSDADKATHVQNTMQKVVPK